MSKLTEKGQALILITLAAIGLFAFAGLAIDGSRAFSDKRHAQNAADTAVLAAALAKARGASYADAALARASSNGYTNNADTQVLVNLCSDPGVTCDGIVPGHESEYIRVRIVSTIPATFAHIIGRQTITSAVEAIARVQGSSSSSSGSSSNGAAMVSTKEGNSNWCFLVNGGADLHIHNSGIYVNCSSNQALFMNGGATNVTVRMDAPGQVVGCYGGNGNVTFDPITCGVNGGVSQTFDASTFASVPTMPATPPCPGNPMTGVGTNSLGPGTLNSILIISSNTVMAPGVYCLNQGINVTGQNTLSAPTGPVTLVMGNNNFNVGNVNFTFDDLEIYTVNGNFMATANGVLNTNRLRFYSSGSGNFLINGQGGVTSNDAYIYLNGGKIHWNGNSTVNLHAAPQNDPEGVGGLLVYMPWSNTTPITFNGGSNIHLTGTCLMPHAPLTFNGGVNFELHSQIIGYEYSVNGGGAIDIFYVAAENYNPPVAANPTIQLTK